MIELTFKTAANVQKPCKKVTIGGEDVVSVVDGWDITEATIGIDERGTKQRLIVTIDRDMDCDNNINEWSAQNEGFAED